MSEGVPHRVSILSGLLHGASLLQDGTLSSIPTLGQPRHTFDRAAPGASLH
jgi:hypothetical protein